MTYRNLPSGLFYAPFGQQKRIAPREGESIDRLYKRLRRLAKKYRGWDRYFVVRSVGDVVTWERVPEGQHRKLAHWHCLNVGETVALAAVDPGVELKRAKDTARYLKRAGKGSFEVVIDGHSLLIRRVEPEVTRLGAKSS